MARLFGFSIGEKEKKSPSILYKLQLEWLWRLKSNTWFRLKRLVTTAFKFVFKIIFRYFSKTNFKNID